MSEFGTTRLEELLREEDEIRHDINQNMLLLFDVAERNVELKTRLKEIDDELIFEVTGK